MTTTDTLITDTEEHLLGGDRDEQNRLSNTVDNVQTQISFDFPLGGIQQGAYVNLDIETMYVWSVNSASSTATVQRGMLGSTPAAHTAGTELTQCAAVATMPDSGGSSPNSDWKPLKLTVMSLPGASDASPRTETLSSSCTLS